MAFTEAGALKEQYNKLMSTLNSDGHVVQALGRNELPRWRVGRAPPKVWFEVRKHADISQAYEHGFQRAEQVAELIERIDRHYRDRTFRNQGLEVARANLVAILEEMKDPKHIQHDRQLLKGGNIPPVVADRITQLKRQLGVVESKKRLLEDRLKAYQIGAPEPQRGVLTTVGRGKFFKLRQKQ